MKVLLGVLMATVGALPAFALHFPIFKPRPVPVPAPDLAVGAPAVLAVIGAYVIARLVIRHRATSKAS